MAKTFVNILARPLQHRTLAQAQKILEQDLEDSSETDTVQIPIYEDWEEEFDNDLFDFGA